MLNISNKTQPLNVYPAFISEDDAFETYENMVLIF